MIKMNIKIGSIAEGADSAAGGTFPPKGSVKNLQLGPTREPEKHFLLPEIAFSRYKYKINPTHFRNLSFLPH